MLSLPLNTPPRAVSGSRDEPPAATDALLPLARAAGHGDAAAQRELCEKLAPTLLAVLRRMLGPTNPDLADHLQESLLGLLRALPAFRGESSVSHFARRIAMKRGIDAQRRARVLASVVESKANEPSPEAALPSDRLLAERLRTVLGALLQELPEAQAEALTMRVVLGHSVAEIAHETRVPLNTVRSRLLLAKKALRDRILADAALSEIAEVAP
jgi:RNA polymerase sigma-70 factor (ECF subfamily)